MVLVNVSLCIHFLVPYQIRMSRVVTGQWKSMIVIGYFLGPWYYCTYNNPVSFMVPYDSSERSIA